MIAVPFPPFPWAKRNREWRKGDSGGVYFASKSLKEINELRVIISASVFHGAEPRPSPHKFCVLKDEIWGSNPSIFRTVWLGVCSFPLLKMQSDDGRFGHSLDCWLIYSTQCRTLGKTKQRRLGMPWLFDCSPLKFQSSKCDGGDGNRAVVIGNIVWICPPGSDARTWPKTSDCEHKWSFACPQHLFNRPLLTA